ncbi:MAG: acetyl-CoA acyltransferase [Vulcanisaeta sp.]|nr:acetyl-CoA acyltransferase [Vulcanisaeta sp.]MCG2870027.1 acetyl-CoA acyltransferase [Vulcanisaeta sp.]MCG2886857.1 acetyl-CoA acyltransferase [Vulcanisaeta sp.]MCG2895495.1 acetyl-CoA acyltransferase [Vulcanisaeta sp.]
MFNTTEVYVVAHSLVPGGRHYEKGLKELFAEAFLRVLDQVGNSQIGAIYVANAFSQVLQDQSALGAFLSDYVGLRRVPAIRIESGDGSSGVAMLEAYNMVKAGIYDCVAVVGVEKMHDVVSIKLNKALATITDYEYEGFFGVTPAAQAAMAMREYMLKYGYDYEDLAIWPIKMHERGSKNPYAYMRKQATLKDILESEVVADPLRLYDTAPAVDGAAAVVLCNKPLRDNAVIKIEGVGIGAYGTYLGQRDSLTELVSVRDATNMALKMAHLSINDINLVEVHDTYSILGMLALESMGLVRPGETPRLLSMGALDAGNKPVVNASGGLKAMGFPGGASGMYEVVSMVMELMNEKPFDSLGKVEYGIVQDMAGFDLISTVMIFRRVG